VAGDGSETNLHCAYSDPKYDFPVVRLTAYFFLMLEPKSYQDDSIRAIVDRWNDNTSVLCCGEVGSGKTLISLAALDRYQSWPALVVVPLPVLEQWAAEAHALGWERHRVHIYHGSYRSLRTFKLWDVLLTTPETLRRELADPEAALHSVTWKIVVVDEVHQLRRGVVLEDEKIVYRNKTYQVMEQQLLRPQQPLLLLLTATPFVNTWTDVLSLGRWLRPQHGGTIAEWRSGAAAQQLMAAHRVDVAVPPVPATTLVDVPHTLTQEERLAYRKVHLKTIRRLQYYLRLPARQRATRQRALHGFLASLTALRRGSVHPRYFGQGRIKHSSKFVAVLQLLRRKLRRKVVVFCSFRRPLLRLRRFLDQHLSPSQRRRCHLHVGGQPQRNRRALQAFGEAAGADVLLATRRSMGVGVNIPWANDVIFLDHDFSRPLEEQAIGRIKRPQRQALQRWTAWYVIPHEPDCMRWMRELQRGKAEDGAALFGGRGAAKPSELRRLGAARPPLLGELAAAWEALAVRSGHRRTKNWKALG
jgi:superfamily II DNA or RNA helicase